MEFITHRKNTLEGLLGVPTKYGVEIDIRSSAGQLVLHHDPFENGELLDNWLSFYNHGTLILNVKEEGLEPRLIALMNKHKIERYFFLDQSFPFLLKFWRQCKGRSAVRVSEYESINTALSLAGKVKWVWVDCFSKFPLLEDDYQLLVQAGFKICAVSPELQGIVGDKKIIKFCEEIRLHSFKLDAVCTKFPQIWEREC
ncbi:hypothetical protein OAV31_00030 [bacterium]|jgi:hypothetical protein|nr:hypothetical protein [bacterium]